MGQVVLKNIQKIYPNGYHAIEDLNLTIPEGQMLVLVGPSGCGKSTLLRMIAGLEEISQGELFIDDKKVNQLEPAQRDIAMVFQNYALYPHMSVYNNMAYGLRNRKTPKADIERLVQEAAQLLELSHLLDRKPGQLSGGQRQRVAMGRAIVRQPKVFLFDEPLSNLDAKLRVQMRLELRRLQQRLATTSVYVTHDQVEAMTLADTLVVLNQGKVEQVAAPMQIYDTPASLFVATFMGSPAMNILDAILTQGTLELGADLQLSLDSHPYDTQTHASHNQAQTPFSQAVKLGMRPEHINLSQTPDFYAKVEFIESLGADLLVYCQLIGTEQSITVRLEGHTQVQIGAQVGLSIERKNLHLFDPKSQKRINHSQ